MRAVATYALTLQDPSSAEAMMLLTSLEQQARQKGYLQMIVSHLFKTKISSSCLRNLWVC